MVSKSPSQFPLLVLDISSFPFIYFLYFLPAGENKVAKENVHLADLILSGLTPASAKSPLKVEVSITAEESMLIKITAVELSSRKAVQIAIPATSS